MCVCVCVCVCVRVCVCALLAQASGSSLGAVFIYRACGRDGLVAFICIAGVGRGCQKLPWAVGEGTQKNQIITIIPRRRLVVFVVLSFVVVDAGYRRAVEDVRCQPVGVHGGSGDDSGAAIYGFTQNEMK